jgi:Mn2+/Fe2+ NRAMP family transporter
MTTNKVSETIRKQSRISKPPLTIKSFLKYLGPAFIFTAAQIGGGEFITVPLLGAYFGMSGLFLVPIIAYIKIFGQYYLVQYGVTRGKTFLQTSWDHKWLRWMFFALMGGCFLHAIMMAGLLGETSGTFNFVFPIDIKIWIIIIAIAGFIIVSTRSYNLLEKTSTVLLWVFLSLIIIVAILFWPTIDQWIVGFTPTFPGANPGLETTSGIQTLAVLFVVLGAGFGPTVSYIFYAKDKNMGMFEASSKGFDIKPEDLTEEEIKRLKGWKKVVLYQNLVSATILSIFSILIWTAAAGTLFKEGIKPRGDDLVAQMILIFTSTYGEWSGYLFMICGSLALFSSVIGPLYGFSRLWEESFERLGLYRKYKIDKKIVFRLCLVMFTLFPLVLALVFDNPMQLFSFSGIVTGPILGLVYIVPIIVLYYEMKKTAPELKPRRYWAMALAILSGILMIVLALMGF